MIAYYFNSIIYMRRKINIPSYLQNQRQYFLTSSIGKSSLPREQFTGTGNNQFQEYLGWVLMNTYEANSF